MPGGGGGCGNVSSWRRRKATKRINCVARLRHPSLTHTHIAALATACVLFCFEGLCLLLCVCVSYTCWVTEKKSRRAGRTSARDARESKRNGGKEGGESRRKCKA